MKKFTSLQAEKRSAFRLFGFSLMLCLFANALKAQTPSAGIVNVSVFPVNCEQDCNTRFCISFENAEFSNAQCDIDVRFDNLFVCDAQEFNVVNPQNQVNGTFLVAADGTWTYCFTGTKDQENSTFVITVRDNQTQNIVFSSTFVHKQNATLNGQTNLIDLIANGVLPPASTAASIKQNLEINGTLLINTDYTFANNSVLRMGADAKIIVDSDASLFINKAFFHTCGDKWEGIEVTSDALLNMSQTVINNAQKAVSSLNNSSVRLVKNSFSNCDIGIQLGDQLSNNVNNLLVANAFIGTGTEIGIKLFNIDNQVQIGSIVGIFARFLASYTNLKKGIEITGGGSVEVFDNIFEDIKEIGIDAKGGPNAILRVSVLNPFIDKCTSTIFKFSNVKNGIVCKNTLLSVFDYTFEDVKQNAIDIDDSGARLSGSIVIRRNLIYANENGIRVILGINRGEIDDNCIVKEVNTASGTAIQMIGDPLVSNGGWDIQKNNINVFEGVSAIRLSNAKFITMSQNDITHTSLSSAVAILGGEHNRLTCNLISNAYVGIDYRGCPSGRIECNQITNSAHAMYYWFASDQTKTLGNMLHGTQSDLRYRTNALTRPEKHAGNQFDAPSHKAVHEGPASIIPSSKYFVNSGTIGIFLPQTIVSPVQWFKDESSNGSYFCEINNCTLPPWNFKSNSIGDRSFEDDELELAIKNNSLVFTSAANAGMNWTLKQHLYKRLLEASAIPQSFTAFYNNHKQGSIGKLYDLRVAVVDAQTLSNAQQTIINSRLTTVAELRSRVNALKLFKEVNGKPTLEVDEAILSDYFNLSKRIGEELKVAGAINKTQQAVFDANIDNFIAQNAQVSFSDGTAATSARLVNDMYFRYLQNDKVLHPFAIDQLSYIAFQCPSVGGDAVYAARALLSRANLNYEYDDEPCVANPNEPIGGKQISNNIPNSSETIAYPNPAQELVNIQRNIENLSLEANVTLSDLTGRTLVQENVDNYIRDFNLNTENLHSGMYLIHIKYQNGKSESLKINIIK